ncbi:TonB-dependent receptor P3 [subsurface metagenome]
MRTQEIPIEGRTTFTMVMEEEIIGMEEVVVVGYGTQKKSDITGTVASLSKDRLEMMPNLNIAQAIQGSIPGVMIQTTTAGAASSEVIMVRGRNSIKASNAPLIVVDGIPYGGALRDINPNDVESIEILKDASAAAIYGSRGSNGVILITSKEGRAGASVISYDGKFSMQSYTNIPDMMDGEEYYKFKMEREPKMMTTSESEVYNSGEWVDWLDLVTRNGYSNQHNLSVSGGFQNTTYYIAGSLLDVQGIQVNDDYLRLTTRINVVTKIKDWLTLGTRTQLSFDDRSGQSPGSSAFLMNPLTRAYDENGNLTIYPWTEDKYFANPLESTLWEDNNKSYQVVTNNFAIIDFPFLKGLSFRLNTGIRSRFLDKATYMGRDGKTGYEAQGRADTDRSFWNNTVIDNILSYNNEIGKHTIFATALYSFEEDKYTGHGNRSDGFPHDFLGWYSSAQAQVSFPRYSFNKTVLISQMIRLNYSYDSRYLITLTGRRDGFSGFGAENKWGIFPSVALGWNLANEDFFPIKNLVNQLKPRISWGLNGNQAIGANETITRLGSADWITSQTKVPGYIPSTVGMDNLGWESSRTLNLGLDYGVLQNRITGDINVYKTNTTDLLLDRTISPVHGITSVTQNIGETENKGIELSFNSRNIVTSDFTWSMSGNMAMVKNKILSLYGILNEEGKEIDDIGNKWFIGHPIRVNYDYIFDGVWQLDEAEEAAKWESQPGFVKYRDVNGDYMLTGKDRQITGQLDPKFLWGLTNSFSFRNFNIDILVHGVHGVTRPNELMTDDVWPNCRRNTINKNWWTPDNPTNDFYMNHIYASYMAGIYMGAESPDFFPLENASFVRIKDISLSYDIPKNIINRYGMERLKLYLTGRNLFTFTKWNGLDPELEAQRGTPLQKEFVFGINLGF